MKRLAIGLLTLLACSALTQHQAEVLELLKSDDWERALVRLTAEKTRLTTDITKSLQHDDPKVKARAAHALRVIDSADQELRSSPTDGLGDYRAAAVEALKRTATDTDQQVNKESVWALAYLLRNRDFGHHGEPWSSPKEVQPIVALGKDATSPLVQLLAHEYPNDHVLYAAKIAAVRVLAATKDPDAIDGLIALIKTASHFLLSEAMNALVEFDDPRIARVLIDGMDQGIDSYSDTPGIWALRRMKERAVPDLLWAVANHSKPTVRGHAAHLFEHTPDPRAIPVLQKAAADSDEYVRASAASALAKNPHPSNTAVLLSLLSDASPEVRAAASLSLGASGHSATFDPVAALLKDSNTRVRQSAAAALPSIDKQRAVSVLVPLLKDAAMQRTVIAALGTLRPKEAEPNLIEIVKSGEEYAQYEAASLLGEMKSAAAVPALLVMLQNDDWFPRSAASKALGKIGKPAVDGLLKLLTKASKDVLPGVLGALGPTGDPRAFDAIVPYLKDEKNRIHAIEALGKSGDRRAIPLIMPYLSSTNDLLRYAVIAAGDLRATEAVPLLIKALEFNGDYVANNAAQALGKIGDKRAFDPLLKVAQDPEFGGRWMAIEALGAFADSRAVPTLIKLLDEDWPDSAAAARALGKIGDRSALLALEKAAKSDEERLATDAKAAIEAIRKKRRAQTQTYDERWLSYR